MTKQEAIDALDRLRMDFLIPIENVASNTWELRAVANRMEWLAFLTEDRLWMEENGP